MNSEHAEPRARVDAIVRPLPVPVLKPFAFTVKGSRSDGFDRHGVWEIVGADGLGNDNERVTIRRIATARAGCPLHEEWTLFLSQISDVVQRVDWGTFLPSERGGI